jgi:hypothetical protein
MHIVTKNWKRIALVFAAIASCAVLALVSLIVYMLFQEGDQTYWLRLYRAHSDIDALQTATESFRKKMGRNPVSLDELTHPDGAAGERFLGRLASNPWGGPYQSEVEHGAGGDKIKIWTVPDRKTQDKTGLPELSNEPNWRAILK